VPQWHLGERWEIWLQQERRTDDGRLLQRSNRYRYEVKAIVAPSPGVREVHIQARPWKKRTWKRAHLVFSRHLSAPHAPGQERLHLKRITVQTLDTPPKQLVLDFGALSDEPFPVLMFGTPLPVSFPLFEMRTLSGLDTRTYRPARRPGAPRDPPSVRQALVDAPPLPVARDVITVDRRRLIEYRLESTDDVLSFIRQIWHPDYPWYVYARGPGRRSGLAEVWRVEGDPLALVDQAARLAGRRGTRAESAALWSFRRLLARETRESLERDGRRPASPATVAERTRAFLGGFGLRGLTPIYARMSGKDRALVDAGGLSADGRLERRLIVCVVEAGEWKLASGAEPFAVTTRPTAAAKHPASPAP